MYQTPKPLSDQIEALISQQIEVGIVADYFSDQTNNSTVYYKPFGVNNEFVCQVNPMRDPANRALLKQGKSGCFLCEENMPDEEDGIQLDSSWKLYPNPRPYEKNHMVMVLMKNGIDHPFQIIDNKNHVLKALETIWQLGYEEKRTGFNLTFNSIHAGASSRHFHFQLFECDLPILNFPVSFFSNGDVKWGELPTYPAGVLVLEGTDKGQLALKTWTVIDTLNAHKSELIPYVLLFKVIDNRIRVYIFPRAAETPADHDDSLINTKFGICEMSGMTIVYNENMADELDIEQYRKSLQAASNTLVLEHFNDISGN